MLDDIVRYKVEETRQKQELLGLRELQKRVKTARPVRDFAAALLNEKISVIAEAKYRSPTKGLLRADFDPIALAHGYQRAGADAISVLADNRFFGGAPFVVSQVANASGVHLPVMYKDFVVDTYQVHEARAVGADAVLLIARIQVPAELRRLVELVQELGMSALVETFDERDIDAALESTARLIGINNRDLDTFAVDFERTERLFKKLPASAIAVSESGISNGNDLLAMQRLGFGAALVGEAIVAAPSPEAAIAGLKAYL